MAKVRTLSRVFMKGHPKQGQPTYFVEYFLNSIGIDFDDFSYLKQLHLLNKKSLDSGKLTFLQLKKFWYSLCGKKIKKGHTLRAGNHFKAGDMISVRCWSGAPYNSTQIILAEDVEIKSVYNVKIINDPGGRMHSRMHIIWADGKNDGYDRLLSIGEVAKNDGLKFRDFTAWFNKLPFTGQIIVWSKKINYGK